MCVAEEPIPIPCIPLCGVGFNYAQRPLRSNVKSKVILLQFMKACKGRWVFISPLILLSELDVNEWSTLRPSYLNSREKNRE